MQIDWHEARTGERREFDQEALNAALSPSRFVASLDDELAHYAARSEAARAQAARDGRLREALRYGEAPEACIDLLMPAGDAPAPLLIYVHGGFWQQLSRRESAFAAPGILPRGGAVAAVGYTLAPHATLAQIVAQVCAAVDWLAEHAESLALDASRFVIAGSSAGAHLAAMTLMDESACQTEFCGAALVSGVYDLAAVRRSYVNEPLKLTEQDEQDLSPARLVPRLRCPAALVVGEHEPDEFKRETRGFADAMALRDWPMSPLQIAGRHHFDVILDLDDPSTYLGHAVAAMMGLPGND